MTPKREIPRHPQKQFNKTYNVILFIWNFTEWGTFLRIKFFGIKFLRTKHV